MMNTSTLKKVVPVVILLEIWLCVQITINIWQLLHDLSAHFLGEKIYAEIFTILFCIGIIFLNKNKYWRIAWGLLAFNEVLKILSIFFMHEFGVHPVIITEICRFVIILLSGIFFIKTYKSLNMQECN